MGFDTKATQSCFSKYYSIIIHKIIKSTWRQIDKTICSRKHLIDYQRLEYYYSLYNAVSVHRFDILSILSSLPLVYACCPFDNNDSFHFFIEGHFQLQF